MSAQWGVASTSMAGKGKKGGRLRVCEVWTSSETPIELLSKREFREGFRVPHGVAIRLMDGGPMPTKKKSYNATVFSKEQFNVRLPFPLPSLFKQFLQFTKIPLAFLHPNTIRILMGCSILDMLFHLDFSLLEDLFVYTVKMSRKGIFSLPLIFHPFNW